MTPDHKTYEDTRLLSLLADGNESAFDEIFERYWEPLFSKAFHFLGKADEAKDCVQDVFIALWQYKSKTSILNLDHYLHQAVRFKAFRVLRENKAGEEFEKRLYQLDKAILTENSLEYKELKVLLENLIATLPEDQRLIFNLHREEELTYRQIAEKLDISIKTVEKKMSRTLRYLRSHAGDALLLALFFRQL